jgi:hypothetical protein
MPRESLVPARTLSKIIIVLMLLASNPATCRAADFSVEFFFGGAFNASTNLRIEQVGEQTLDFKADWDTRSFEQPLYWAVRLTLTGPFRDGLGLELQMIHHKIYLENRPSEVQQFEISHGFNILTLNVGHYSLPVALRAGAGVVVAHTDSVIRGLRSDSGYEVTGPAFIAGAGRRIQIWSSLFASFDLQVSAARAKVSVPEGKAYTSNYALHLMAGVGYAF